MADCRDKAVVAQADRASPVQYDPRYEQQQHDNKHEIMKPNVNSILLLSVVPTAVSLHVDQQSPG